MKCFPSRQLDRAGKKGQTMSDEPGLLAAIWNDSHDDLPRLVYADWLQDTGEPAQVARGEFIRVQCELARIAVDDPRSGPLRKREKELWNTWKAQWRSALRGEAKRWPFHRGFPHPDDRGINAADLFRRTKAQLLAAPARSFHVMDGAQHFDELLAWPWLDRLEIFYFRSGLPQGDWLSRTLACQGFRNVRRLVLIDCPIVPAPLEALLTAWQGRLVEVNLNGSAVGDDGLRMVLQHPVVSRLQTLAFRSCGITAAGLQVLATSDFHPLDASCGPGGNAIGDEGVVEMLRWPGLARIQSLFLNDAGIGNAGVVALAESPAVANVRRLWLGYNQIGAAGATALVGSPHLRRLEDLYLHANPLPAPAVQALRTRFGKRLKAI
jgi:uncharacterized protein (TIGR02996 family)